MNHSKYKLAAAPAETPHVNLTVRTTKAFREQLRERAERNRRSLNSEILVLLETAMREDL